MTYGGDGYGNDFVEQKESGARMLGMALLLAIQGGVWFSVGLLLGIFVGFCE